MKIQKMVALFLSVLLLLSSSMALAEQTYEGVGKGRNGDVKVQVVLDNGAIQSVSVIEHTETAGLSDPAIEKIPAAIVENQSLKVDAVSGVTLTSDAIIEAVSSAISAAGLDVAAYMKDVAAAEKEALDIGERDIIVVGGGMAGMIAALRAAELGKDVVIFERTSQLGGAASLSAGYIHGVNSRLQREAGITDTPEALVADFMSINSGDVIDYDRAMRHAEKIGEAVDWIESFGNVEFDGTMTFGTPIYHPMSVTRISTGKETGMSYTKGLSSKVAEFEQSGDILVAYDTLVTEVVLDENGAACGVVADGVVYHAPVVIMATGGYGSNEEWVKRNIDNFVTSSPASADGLGIEICQKLGAQLTHMDYQAVYAGAIPCTGLVNTKMFSAYAAYPSVIWVDNTGKRMTNETVFQLYELCNVWRNAPENEVYVLFTEDMMRDDFSMVSELPASEYKAFFAQLEAEGNCVFKADTIEALAEKIGMEPAALRNTIDTYNGYCDAGVDAEFGRTSSLDKFEKGPFYALYTVPWIVMTEGGVITDLDFRLLDADGEVIPGVYACGEMIGTGSINGEECVGGIGLSVAASTGMIAAETAVADLNK